MILRSLAAAAAALLVTLPATAERSTVLAGGTLVDGYGGPALRDAVVVITGERIAAVGTVGNIDIPENADVVSTEGMTVLPGLWDLQVHLARLGHGDERRWSETYMPIAGRVVMPLAAAQLLSAGVTSARVLGAPADVAVGVRDSVRDQRIPGPTLFVTGAQLAKTADVDDASARSVISGEAEARKKVAGLAAAGADYVLLAETDLWSEEELAAAVNEARVRNLLVFSRAERHAAIERSLAVGVDGFLGLDEAIAPGLPGTVVVAIEARTSDAGKRPLSWSPAVSGVLNYDALGRNPEPLDDPRAVEGLPPLVAADVLTSLRPLDGIRWYEMPATRAPLLCERVRQLEAAGVLLVLGSDSGAPAHLHSRATWQEIDFWVRECGLDPVRAIQAATHDAALAMRVEHESGTVTPGKYADVIAVRGDVLRNPDLLQRVDIVFRRGQRHR